MSEQESDQPDHRRSPGTTRPQCRCREFRAPPSPFPRRKCPIHCLRSGQRTPGCGHPARGPSGRTCTRLPGGCPTARTLSAPWPVTRNWAAPSGSGHGGPSAPTRGSSVGVPPRRPPATTTPATGDAWLPSMGGAAVLALAAGAGIGHVAWSSNAATTSAAPASGSAPSSSGRAWVRDLGLDPGLDPRIFRLLRFVGLLRLVWAG